MTAPSWGGIQGEVSFLPRAQSRLRSRTLDVSRHGGRCRARGHSLAVNSQRSGICAATGLICWGNFRFPGFQEEQAREPILRGLVGSAERFLVRVARPLREGEAGSACYGYRLWN